MKYHFILVPLALLGLLGSYRLSVATNDEVAQINHRMKDVDHALAATARLQLDVLRTRFGVERNDEQLVHATARLRESARILVSEIPSSDDHEVAEQRALAEHFVRLVDSSLDAVERFKSEHSILVNSTRFLPRAMRELADKSLPADRPELHEIRALVTDVLGQALHYEPALGQASRVRIERMRERIREFDPMLIHELDVLLSHCLLVLNGQEQVQTAMDELTGSRAPKVLLDLEALLADRAREREGRAVQYRNLTYALAGAIVFWLLVVLLSLAQSRARARRTNAELEARNAELAAERERAEEATRAKAAFLANMSHELRTPLTGIIGMSEMLGHTALERQQSEYVDIIHRSALSLIRVINDILDLSKLEVGKFALENAAYDVRGVVATVCETLAIPAQDKGLELLIADDPALPATIVGDSARVGQVLFNLVGNAIKFTERGHVCVRMEVRRREGGPDEPGVLALVIEDTGIGIDEDKIAVIFEEFEQADSSDARRYGGTGLGLSISKRLVELMGGTLTLESTRGRGTEITMAIPWRSPDGMEPVNTAPLRHAHIAVVSDYRPQCALLEELLGDRGAQVTVAHTVEEIWPALAGQAPGPGQGSWRGVIVDERTPDFDCAALLERMRGEEHLMHTPLIVLTPMRRGGGVVQPGGEGGESVASVAPLLFYVSKPARPVRLLSRLLRRAATTRLPALAHLDEGDRSASAARILLCEDNPVNQKVARAMLERLGHQVHVVENGLDALRALGDEPFDLVLMDCQMPELDGYQTTRRIREDLDENSDIVIVAQTASVLSEDVERALECGMDDVLAKPFDTRSLTSVLDKWLA